MQEPFDKIGGPLQPTDSVKTAEQEARVSLITTAVSNHFPEKDYLTLASQQADVKVEDLSEDWKGWAKDKKNQFKLHRQELIKEIVTTQIKPGEVEEYILTSPN